MEPERIRSNQGRQMKLLVNRFFKDYLIIKKFYSLTDQQDQKFTEMTIDEKIDRLIYIQDNLNFPVAFKKFLTIHPNLLLQLFVSSFENCAKLIENGLGYYLSSSQIVYLLLRYDSVLSTKAQMSSNPNAFTAYINELNRILDLCSRPSVRLFIDLLNNKDESALNAISHINYLKTGFMGFLNTQANNNNFEELSNDEQVHILCSLVNNSEFYELFSYYNDTNTYFIYGLALSSAQNFLLLTEYGFCSAVKLERIAYLLETYEEDINISICEQYAVTQSSLSYEFYYRSKMEQLLERCDTTMNALEIHSALHKYINSSRGRNRNPSFKDMPVNEQFELIFNLEKDTRFITILIKENKRNPRFLNKYLQTEEQFLRLISSDTFIKVLSTDQIIEGICALSEIREYSPALAPEQLNATVISLIEKINRKIVASDYNISQLLEIPRLEQQLVTQPLFNHYKEILSEQAKEPVKALESPTRGLSGR